MVEPLDWDIERVLFAKESGPEKRDEVTCPVPFPVRRPPKVVEPVPPKPTETVVVPMTLPWPFPKRMEFAMVEMARLVVVACWREELPRTVRVPLALRAPPTLRRDAIVVEPMWYEEPVVVAPPLMVSPPAWVPEPMVEVEYAVKPPLNWVNVLVALPETWNGYEA